MARQSKHSYQSKSITLDKEKQNEEYETHIQTEARSYCYDYPQCDTVKNTLDENDE